MKLSQKSQVLAMLKAGPVTTHKFLEEYLYEFRSRITELRQEGHRIEAERIKQGLWEYKLVDRLSTHAEPQG